MRQTASLDMVQKKTHTEIFVQSQKRRVRNTASKSASVVEIESSVQPSIGSNDDERFRPRKRKAGFSDSTNAPRGQKKARIVESEESDQSLPPPLSVIPPKRDVNHASSVGSLHRSNVQDELSNNIDRTGSLKSSPAETRTVPAEGAPLGLRSPTHGSRGGTPAPFVATQAVVKSDDDMEEFFASYRNIMQVEPQSPERLPGHVKLYTDQIFESRDEFVDAVLRHTEERNPGCRLAVANTDPARVRVYCMRADCPYSFNSVYEHGARRVPAVKVTAVCTEMLSTFYRN